MNATGGIGKTGAKRRRAVKGICRMAKTLGVHREHLRLVLIGKRQSRSLLERYHALCRKDGPEASEPGLPNTTE